MKRILVIGASGTIGKAVCTELSHDNEVLEASFSSSEFSVDIADTDSVRTLFESVGTVDHVVCAAARGVIFKPLSEMSLGDYQQSMQSKLMGQIDVVLQGMDYVTEGGSFTLTTGILNVDPILQGTAAALVNAGVEGFVQAACMDMPKNLRINVVSPALLTASQPKLKDFFPGYATVSSDAVAQAYRKSVFAGHNGRIYRVV